MDRKATSITLRTTERRKAKAKDAAEKRGITLSDFIDEAVEFYSGLDDYAARCLMRWGDTLRLPESLIMSNVFIRRLAELRALEVVSGPVEPEEFVITSQGPRAGEALYERLFKSFEQKFNLAMVPDKKRRLESINILINDPDRTAEKNKGYIKEKAELEAWLEQNDPVLRAERISNERETRPLTSGFHVGAEDDPYKS